MTQPVVIDTNVAIVANGRAPHVSSDCVNRCIDRVDAIRASVPVCIDTGGLILTEYARHLNRSGEPGVGDAFFKWLIDNEYDSAHCHLITVTPDGVRGFLEFPDDSDLAGFDPSDRVFVAVAVASGMNPPILHATDRGWWWFETALRSSGVRVEHVCPAPTPTRKRRRPP